MTILRELTTRLRFRYSTGDRRVHDDYNRALDRSRANARSQSGALDGMRRSVMGLNAGLLAMTASLGFAFGGKEIFEAGNALDELENKIRAVDGRLSNVRGIRRELAAIAFENFSTLEDTASIYQRFRIGTEDMGKSSADIIKFTDRVQKVAAMSGASQQETSNALIQFSQGISSNRFSGEEFRSVSEQLPTILRVLKKDLGKTTAELREMAFAGELTAETIFTAFERQGDKILEDFGNIEMTFGRGKAQFKTGFTTFFGSMMQESGFNDDFAVTLSMLGELMLNGEGFARKIGKSFKDLGFIIGEAVGAIFSSLGGGSAGGALTTFASGIMSSFEKLRSFMRAYTQLREMGDDSDTAFKFAAEGIFSEETAKRLMKFKEMLLPVGQAIAAIFGARAAAGALQLALTIFKLVRSLSPLGVAISLIAVIFNKWNDKTSQTRKLFDRLQKMVGGDFSVALAKVGQFIEVVLAFVFQRLGDTIEFIAFVINGLIDLWNGPFGQVIRTIAGLIYTGLVVAFETVMSIIKGVIDFSLALQKAFTDTFTAIMESDVVKFFTNFVSMFFELSQLISTSMFDGLFDGLANSPAFKAVSAVIDGLRSAGMVIGDAAGGAAGAIGGKASEAGAFVGNAAMQGLDFAKNAVNGATNSIIGGAEKSAAGSATANDNRSLTVNVNSAAEANVVGNNWLGKKSEAMNLVSGSN